MLRQAKERMLDLHCRARLAVLEPNNPAVMRVARDIAGRLHGIDFGGVDRFGIRGAARGFEPVRLDVQADDPPRPF